MITYRKAIREDIWPAFDLALRVFMKFEAPISDTAAVERFQDDFEFKKTHPDLWDVGDRLMFIALDDSTIVGMVDAQGNGHIQSFYVDSAYHRRGIGTELLSRMVCELKLRGCDQITLDSFRSGMPFFHSFGFYPTGDEQTRDGFICIPMAYEPNEIWDVLDEHGNKTGRYTERGRKRAPGDYHLVVHVWKRNSQGEWLIDRRVPRITDNLGGKWETTGGSAVAGDDSLAAALRETKEELGIDLDPDKGTLFRRIVNRGVAGNTWLTDAWVFEWNGTLDQIRFQKGETCDAVWVTADKIRDMMDSGEFLSYNIYSYFYEMVERFSK